MLDFCDRFKWIIINFLFYLVNYIIKDCVYLVRVGFIYSKCYWVVLFVVLKCLIFMLLWYWVFIIEVKIYNENDVKSEGN